MKTILLTVLVIVGFISSAGAQVLPTNAVVEGKSIGEWSAEWWKWLLPIPIAQNPARDPDGSRAATAQPEGAVFFLAKGYNWNIQGMRTFTVPEEKYLFMPLMSGYYDNIGAPNPYTVEELRDLVKGAVDTINDLHATIDGVLVPELFSHRTASPVFSVNFLSPDNLISEALGQPFVGWDDPMVADGYYLMIEPLSVGTHVLNFGGMIGPPVNLFQDMTDFITVIAIPLPERVERLIASVRESTLAPNRQRSLLSSLNAAKASFDSGTLLAGIDQLHAFAHKLHAQLADRDQALADEWTHAAQIVIDKAAAQLRE